MRRLPYFSLFFAQVAQVYSHQDNQDLTGYDTSYKYTWLIIFYCSNNDYTLQLRSESLRDFLTCAVLAQGQLQKGWSLLQEGHGESHFFTSISQNLDLEGKGVFFDAGGCKL